MGWYRQGAVEPGLYGDTGTGVLGVLSRLTDTFSYFTIWSNLAVAVAVTLLALRPSADSTVRRVLHLDALLMITVTAIVYQVLLAPVLVIEGWARLTDPVVHVVPPAVTVVVWLVWGPHGRFDRRVVAGSLLLPMAWAAWCSPAAR